MKRFFRHETWILIAATVAFFTNLGATRLWDEDESFFAATASEMHVRGEWTVPYFNGELFSHKPPFMYWMMLLGYRVFGDSEFAVRFFSAVFGTATALLTYRLGRRLFCAEVGFWAGLAMTSALMFDVVARAATADSFLVFFSVLALYLFVCGSRGENETGWTGMRENLDPTPSEHPLLPKSWKYYALMYAAMGLAVLVKGPIGVLLPMATIGLFLLCTSPRVPPLENGKRFGRLRRLGAVIHPGLFCKTVWEMRPFTAIAMVSLVAAPWFLAVSLRTGSTFVLEFLGIHNFGRFVDSMDGHSGPIFYYLPVIMIGFFPWSIFALQMLRDTIGRIRHGDSWKISCIFVVCWAGVFIGFFSLASTKLPNYVLPAYPALALMTACFLHRWIHRPQSVPVAWIRTALGTFVGIGAVLMIALPVVGTWRVGEESLLESVGVAAAAGHELPLAGLIIGIGPLVGGMVALILAEQKRPRQAVVGLAIASVVFVTSLLGFAAVRADRHQTSEEIAAIANDFAAGDKITVGQYRYFRPSLIYYTRQTVTECKTTDDLERFFAVPGKSVLVTTMAKFDRIAETLPRDIVVLDRRPQFPQKGTVLVLGHRNPTIAAENTASQRN